jgi:hypothetical protein
VKKINNKLDNESYKEYLINYHKDIIDWNNIKM